jgi:hypothetical protein
MAARFELTPTPLDVALAETVAWFRCQDARPTRPTDSKGDHV